jgi:hypothetical protein
LNATKLLTIEQWALTEDVQEKVKNSKTCQELHTAMGKDFWVVTELTSTSRERKLMEGTRLTIQKNNLGYDFTIRTPALPRRYPEFHYEFNFLFDKLKNESRKDKIDIEIISDLILRIYFYWVNFGPLTRGILNIFIIRYCSNRIISFNGIIYFF